MLMADDISYAVGGTPLLSHVSAAFPASRVTGIIGPNGAGKSTLLRIAAGLLAPGAGQVSCMGEGLAGMTLARRARHLAYMPQDMPTLPPMPVREVASLGRLPYGESPAQALHHLAVTQALDKVGLTGLAHRLANQLSGGERARLMLARALAMQTPILLADEPVAALDPAHALAVMGVFAGLAASGRCVVVVLHDLLLATRFCDTLIMMKDGHILHQLAPAHLTDAMVRQTYGVTSRRVDGAFVPWDLCTTDPSDQTR
ncbi:ABC transporter ATP-binding protein [Acetobacter sp. TBRC 12305]|uniref:ABC transporter ATP-binding protein n=1 Tax=Acetobacter garciniae TaxID=2817435 RepID=A0A939HL02_9PROT|nr:ABC transporter ATP-binding protein [Acetobacter garciniae]MBO1323564.1 ABC transporter ATP-binding protein [Acetobacter garciniae]MBX0343253.1 ABC transporter ATP-binding protein [Acetobacter garciniae]